MDKNRNLESIKERIVRAISSNKDDSEWCSMKIEIDFPPFINRGLRITHHVKGLLGEQMPIAVVNFEDSLNNLIYSFIVGINETGNFNQIVFSADKNRLNQATIELIFNESVDEVFQRRIPKAQRGKHLPWWKNPEETKGL